MPQNVRVWDVQSGSEVAELPETGSGIVRFSPDNRWLATCTHAEFRLWKVDSWECAQAIARTDTGNFPGPIAFSRDSHIAAFAHTRRTVRLVDPATGAEFATLEAPYPQGLSWLSFSPDGTRLAAAAETKQIQLWDLRWIRRQLAAMNLDWESPPYSDPENSPAADPLSLN